MNWKALTKLFCLLLLLGGGANATAQSVTTLVNFTGANGADPFAGLTLGADGNFYGTTLGGGSSGRGTVFQVTTNGTLTTLVNFTSPTGQNPWAGLTVGADGNFYGTTKQGGTSGFGTVFKATTNGTLTTLLNFSNANGAYPFAGLTVGADGNFYGTTYQGGSSGAGTVFKMTTNGTLTTLVNFNNANGANPYAGLTLGTDGNFYGTTEMGGSDSAGTVFKVTTNGTLTTLVNFTSANGEYPEAGLTVGADGNFYGTTYQGGSVRDGEVYRLNLPTLPPYTASPTNALAGAIVQFNSTNVDSTGNSITQWNWNFDDGGTSTAQNPTHVYATASTFKPTLTVTNSVGVAITVSGPAIHTFVLTAQFTANPTNGTVPETVQFSGPGVDSGGNSITQWNWSFGDGSNSAVQYPTHIYTAAGTYYPALIVTNSLGLAITATGPAITVTTPPAGTGISLKIYDDALENGWQDYGFATDNYSNHAPVHSGTNSISVTITSPYQGIQMHHVEFTNTAYANISFWLNGGATGGQQLQVYGVLGGVNQTPRFYLSAPAANTWQQYIVPLSALGVANATNFSAFVIQDYAGTAEPTFYLDDIQLNSPFVVLNTNDAGAYSLREALAIAPSGSTITFDPSLSGQTILLASTLNITTNLTIDASALSGGIQINGNGSVEIFNVLAGSMVVMNSLTITNGNSSVNRTAGGIYNVGALTLNNSTISGNTASSFISLGAGIYNGGSLWLNQCNLSGNISKNSGAYGGAINNSGTLTVNQCTLSGNSAGNGGGIFNGGTLTVNQSTFSGNSAPAGGGIANEGTLTLNQSTMSGNTGGIESTFSSPVTVNNSIVTGNSATSVPDISVIIPLICGGSNIVQTLSGSFTGSAPITNIPAQLAPLGNYGGPTPTMPPLPGSPAIGAGSTNGNTFTTDQRGYPRTQNGLIDIGAVELPTVQPFTASLTNGLVPLTVHFTATNTDSDGSAITQWNWTFGDGGTSAAQNPAHVYGSTNSYAPVLIVTNSLGLTLAATGPAIVVVPLSVSFTASPTNGLTPLAVQFNCTNMDNGGNSITRWNWTFGDGATSTAQNPVHTYAGLGNYIPTLTVTNSAGIAIAATGPSIAVTTNLVANGGFEAGNFSGWTVTGDAGVGNSSLVDDGTSGFYAPHAGGYYAALGTSSTYGYLSQTLATTAGASYLLSFWRNNQDGAPNSLAVSWNGGTVFGPTNLPTTGWTLNQFSVKATSASTPLQFQFENNGDVLGLDDVGVVAMPSPALTGSSVSQTNLVFSGSNGLAGIKYLVLASTNLALPRSQWTPVATNILGANGNYSFTVTNAVNKTATKEFYLLQVP